MITVRRLLFHRARLRNLLICIGGVCIVSTVYLIIVPLYDSKGSCDCSITKLPPSVSAEHRLAVLVPFRDRFDELLQFAPHINTFLMRQNVWHQVFVVNQDDGLRFNRASLINAGFLEVQNHFDYFVMHDVDLLPDNPHLDYGYPSLGPFHVAAPELHPKYHYKKFVGGILLIKNEHFKLVNGLSNRYWGWGLEDDEFRERLYGAGLTIYRPIGITTGNATFKHLHQDKQRRPRDYRRVGDQKKVSNTRDLISGLSTLKYRLTSRRELTIDGVLVTVLNIRLTCDYEQTPWCVDGPQRAHELGLLPTEN